MKIIFKQVIDGLVRTTTVSASKPPCSPYTSVDGRDYPVIYQGLNVLELSGADPDTGLPMHFEANLEYFFREGKVEGIRRYCPGIQELDVIQGIQLAQEAAPIMKIMKDLDKDLKKLGSFPPAHSYLGVRKPKQYWQEHDKLTQQIQRLIDQNGQKVMRWQALFGTVKKQAQAYWQAQIDQLKAIPDGTYWLTPEPELNEEESYFIRIDGGEEQLVEISPSNWPEGSLTVRTGDEEYLLFPDLASAGEAARAYWEDMAHSDPKEFACTVGDDTLISWALGNPGGPGSVKVSSLEGWLDLYLDHPNEHWATYDGKQSSVEVSPAIEEEYGNYTVAYRTN